MFARHIGVSRLAILCDLIEFIGVMLVLALAFIFQIIYKELPCPLCLLQRLGFFFIAFGLLLNLRFGPRPSHYSVILLSALFTSFVALRQIALHVVPGTGAYGDPVFGLHMYTWSFIISMAILITTSIMLGVERQYQLGYLGAKKIKWLVHISFAALVLLIGLNIGSIVMECGLSECPENPVQYIH